MLRDSFRIWQTNAMNMNIYLSTDGATDMKKFPAYNGRAADNKTNDMFRAAGTQWYIRTDAIPATPLGWFGLEVEYV